MEAKVEGSSRAVLGQQVRFKVDKLKQLLADGASEAEVTAAYTEVREDYPGKCEHYVERPRQKTQTVDVESFCPGSPFEPSFSPRRGLLLCSMIR